jgi:hypothetical protein
MSAFDGHLGPLPTALIAGAGRVQIPATLGWVSTPAAERAAVVACALGLGHAAVSAYWALGGTALLDTIGGSIERWGREREPALIAALWLIVVVKMIVGLAAPVLAGVGAGHLPSWTGGRVPRILGWIAATVLVLYGGVLTVAGLLAEAGVLEVAADADQRALAWHAFVWDPWFLLWGVAFSASLWLTRPGLPTEQRTCRV